MLDWRCGVGGEGECRVRWRGGARVISRRVWMVVCVGERAREGRPLQNSGSVGAGSGEKDVHWLKVLASVCAISYA